MRLTAILACALFANPAAVLAQADTAGAAQAEAAVPAGERPLSPTAAFLRAADRDDQPAMLALLGKTALPGELKGCYLRRVYSAPGSEIIAAWMCAEGEKASRVVLGSVSDDGTKVQLKIVQETRNARPAPPRTEPALAPDPVK